MKRLVTILVLLCLSLIICQAQDLSVIKNGSNYLLVKSQKSSKVWVDSTQLQVLTVTTVENNKIVIDTIKSDKYSNIKSLETMIIRNYDELKMKKSVAIDSSNNVYSLKKIWQKERVKKHFTLSRNRNVITVKVSGEKNSIWPNLEYFLLLSLLFYLLYIKLNHKKTEARIEIIMTCGLMIITAIAWPSNSIEGNILSIIMIPLMLNLIIFSVLRYIGATTDLAIALALSLFAGYLSRSFDLALITTGLSFLAILIICRIRDRKKVRAIAE